MENKVTDGSGVSNIPTITEVTQVQSTGELPNFDLTGLGTIKTDDNILISDNKTEEDKIKEAEKVLEEKKLTEEKDKNNTNEEPFFEFENNKFKLDENGNALNTDGTIFKTKEELDKINSENVNIENELPPLIQDVIKLNGVEILDESGKPKVYEDTEAGLVQYAQDFAKHEVEQSQKAFFEQLPQVKELAQFIYNGGKEEDFYKSKLASWKNTILDKDNEGQLSDIVKKDLISKGHNEAEADELVLLFKDSNKLVEKGELALENQRKIEVHQEEQQKEKKINEQKEYQENVNNYWDKINGIVKIGKLENITIPETDKDGFFNYIGRAVDKNGNSQADLDEKNAKLEFNLQLQYLRYKKFDLSKLITNTANTQKVINLRERINKEKKETNNADGNTNKEIVAPSEVNISINSLLGI